MLLSSRYLTRPDRTDKAARSALHRIRRRAANGRASSVRNALQRPAAGFLAEQQHRQRCHHERAGAERQAINAPVQGTAADIIKRAMVRMEPALAAAGLGHVRMLLQVHDELVFEAPEDEVEKALPVITRIMVDAPAPALTLRVPLVVEARAALNWEEAH